MAGKFFKHTRLQTMINNVLALNMNEIFYIVFSEDGVKKEIIRLNTQKQLFKQGIGSDNIKLSDKGGGYTPFTISIKRLKGLPVDRVTLRDEGDFYKSFRVEVSRGNSTITIEADAIKEDGSDLTERYGDEVLGLTKESKDFLVNFVINQYREVLRAKILQ